ncbi:MAG TPA: histidine kinase [Propionibacteriaceae bacterium]
MPQRPHAPAADRSAAPAPRSAEAAAASAFPGLLSGAPLVAPRIAFLVLLVVCVGTALLDVLLLAPVVSGAAGLIPPILVLALLVTLQIGYFGSPRTDLHSSRALLLLGVQLVLTAAPIPIYGESWLGTSGFLAGSALLVLPPHRAKLGALVVVLATVAVYLGLSELVFDSVYVGAVTALTGLVIFGLSRMRSLVAGLDKARSELATLAVSRERLRFSRDLHDLLGYSLSAITLKCELTRRLLPDFPRRAERELGEVLTIAYQALDDVRQVVNNYRQLSLTDELNAAHNILTTAGITNTINRKGSGHVPDTIGTACAIIVRESVTNILRHSSATHASITLEQHPRHLDLVIANDGLPARPIGLPSGNGTQNLTNRTQTLGGTFTAGPTGPDGYRIQARIPLPDIAAEQTLDEDGVGVERSRTPLSSLLSGRPLLGPRFAWVMMSTVYVVYGLTNAFAILASRLPLVDQAISVAACVIAVVLQFRYFSRSEMDLPRRTVVAALLVQTAVVLIPSALFANQLPSLAGFLVGSILLVVRRRPAVALAAVVVVGLGLLRAQSADSASDIGYGFIATINSGLVVFGLSRLRSLVTGLDTARSELATLAVTQERLRFARDLHDLLGYSLSAITLKCELTRRLIPDSPTRAEQEISEVLVIGYQALDDVRQVVNSYRELSLTDELTAAHNILTTAGIPNTITRTGAGDIPVNVGTACAFIVRESVTNILRHSNATQTSIALDLTADALDLTLVNDGLHVQSPGLPTGNGTTNLASRTEALGGVFMAGPTAPDTYRVHAHIPLRDAPSEPPAYAARDLRPGA